MKLFLYKLLLFLKVMFREFKAQKLRMALTILGITWGTIAITLLMAFSVGIERQMMKANAGMGQGIIVIWPGQTTMAFHGLPPGRRITFIPEDMTLLKERVPGIDKISGEYERWGPTLAYGKKQVNKLISGVYPDFGEMRAHYPQTGGRFIDQVDFDSKRRVIFLGNKVANELFGTENPVGKMITVQGISFMVIGVMIHKSQDSSYHGSDEDYAVIPASTFVALFGDPYFDNMVYSLKPGVDSKSVRNDFFRVLGGKYRFDPKDTHTLWFWDLVEQAETQRKIFVGINIFMWFIGGMTLVIAGVGVANIMFVAIKERTREIGTKMALGAKRSHLMFQFMTEAMFISLSGGLLGIIVSMGVARAFWLIPMKGAMAFMGKPLVNLPIAIVTVITLSLIGFLSGFFPARRAASINPVEALRYE
ncbi:MAG TPA: ABC transporter permease [candidate division Zixibacteria bacterium]|nr:ABC transporter permease [candidate division Zixibacteria bacterium]